MKNLGIKSALVLSVLVGALAATARAEDKMQIGDATITPGKVTEATPPKPSDRAGQSKAAAAAAAAGAGMQKVMCMKMMADAMQESDSTNKALMMMMANQACQQASQTEQNAKKNDDQNKLLTADDIPKQGSLTAGTFSMKSDAKPEATLPMDTPSGGGGDSSGGSAMADSGVPLLQPPDPSVYTLKTPASAPSSEPAPGKPEPDPPTSGLAPIKPASVGYNENASKNGLVQAPTSGYPGGGGPANFAASRTLAQETSANGKAEQAGPIEGARAAKRLLASGGAGAPTGGGPAGEGASPGNGNEAFDALLAQMLGGGSGGGDFGPGRRGQDIVVLPGKGEATKLPNIFEFANWRYQKAAFDEGRVRHPTPKNPILPPTSKIARMSKH